MTDRHDVVVLGSGVIGLTITLELLKEGFKPAIIARDLAEDIYSTGHASPWAVSRRSCRLRPCQANVEQNSRQGANWHSFEPDPKSRALQWDIATYKRFIELNKERPDLCGKAEFVDVYQTRVPKEDVPFSHMIEDVRGNPDIFHLMRSLWSAPARHIG